MSVLVKAAKNPPKDLTDLSLGVLKLTGAEVHNDPFMAIASKIEKVSSRAEVESIFKASIDAAGFTSFALGGAVVRAQELFKTAKSQFPEYKSFREYVERGLGIEYTYAMRAAQAYWKILDLNVPFSAFGGIGLQKALKLLQVVTKDNIAEWVEKAKAMNILSLDEAIKAAKALKSPDDAPAEAKTIMTKTFKLHEDQKQLVNDALKKASEETGSNFEAVNLEAICQSYIGAGLMFANVAQAMAYAAKHTTEPALFVAKQVALLEQLFPDLQIKVDITFKEPAPAVQDPGNLPLAVEI